MNTDERVIKYFRRLDEMREVLREAMRIVSICEYNTILTEESSQNELDRRIKNFKIRARAALAGERVLPK